MQIRIKAEDSKKYGRKEGEHERKSPNHDISRVRDITLKLLYKSP